MLCQDVLDESYSKQLQMAGYSTRIEVSDLNNESLWTQVYTNSSMRVHYECEISEIQIQNATPGAYNCCCQL